MHFTDWAWRANVGQFGGGRPEGGRSGRQTRGTVLLVLAYLADIHLRAGHGPDVWIDVEDIVRFTGFRHRTVTENLRALVRLGLADQLPRLGRTSQWRMCEAARKFQAALPQPMSQAS